MNILSATNRGDWVLVEGSIPLSVLNNTASYGYGKEYRFYIGIKDNPRREIIENSIKIFDGETTINLSNSEEINEMIKQALQSVFTAMSVL